MDQNTQIELQTQTILHQTPPRGKCLFRPGNSFENFIFGRNFSAIFSSLSFNIEMIVKIFGKNVSSNIRFSSASKSNKKLANVCAFSVMARHFGECLFLIYKLLTIHALLGTLAERSNKFRISLEIMKTSDETNHFRGNQWKGRKTIFFDTKSFSDLIA